MDYVKTSYYLSVFIQFISLIIQHYGLELNVPEQHAPLKSALHLEYYVSIIEFSVYIWLGVVLTKLSEITPRRYLDWFITTNILLITTAILMLYEKQKAEGFVEKESAEEMINNNKDSILKILVANTFMLCAGFLGETKKIDKNLGLFAGLGGFGFSFYTFYDTFAKHTEFGKMFFMAFMLIWLLYAVAYMMNPTVKNVMYNILDLISKNAFGVYLMYRLYNIKD